jgi:hypothetical protein
VSANPMAALMLAALASVPCGVLTVSSSLVLALRMGLEPTNQQPSVTAARLTPTGRPTNLAEALGCQDGVAGSRLKMP